MILADQLTLSQPLEADYAHQMIVAPLDFLTLLKFMKSQNEYMKLSHCPKFERNIREISALDDYID